MAVASLPSVPVSGTAKVQALPFWCVLAIVFGGNVAEGLALGTADAALGTADAAALGTLETAALGATDALTADHSMAMNSPLPTRWAQPLPPGLALVGAASPLASCGL